MYKAFVKRIVDLFFSVVGIILLFPFFLNFLPAYQNSASDFRITALTMVLYTNCFGYSGLLIANGKEMQIGIITFIILLFPKSKFADIDVNPCFEI